MVNLNVKDGRIGCSVASENGTSLYDEVGNGIAELLVEYQIELLRQGYSRIQVSNVIQQLVGSVLATNPKRINEKVSMLTDEVTVTS